MSAGLFVALPYGLLVGTIVGRARQSARTRAWPHRRRGDRVGAARRPRRRGVCRKRALHGRSAGGGAVRALARADGRRCSRARALDAATRPRAAGDRAHEAGGSPRQPLTCVRSCSCGISGRAVQIVGSVFVQRPSKRRPDSRYRARSGAAPTCRGCRRPRADPASTRCVAPAACRSRRRRSARESRPAARARPRPGTAQNRPLSGS